jgi:hypothetical protein
MNSLLAPVHVIVRDFLKPYVYWKQLTSRFETFLSTEQRPPDSEPTKREIRRLLTYLGTENMELIAGGAFESGRGIPVGTG